MFSLTVKTAFVADHQLTMPNGSKEHLHRHNWLVEASVSGKKLDEMGLLMDFHEIKRKLNAIVKPFGNRRLEQLDCFENISSSAENVARYVFDQLKDKLPQQVKLDYILITEEPDCQAKYCET